MASTLTQSPLAANLASLGERNADVTRRLETTPAAGDIRFEPSKRGALTGQDPNGPLASRHDPRGEGERLVERIDVVANATTVVLGFGLGYHVEALARRYDGNGLIVVFEPDVALLKAVFEHIDHSAWMARGLVVFVTDPEDRAALAHKLDGAETILAQGLMFLEHPPSRRRLGEVSTVFTTHVVDLVQAAKTTFITTLVRGLDTIRNLLRNADFYVGGQGVKDLENTAENRLGIVVSAGPSLHKNIHVLTEPAVRERCIIIAVQTTLKPLLDAGVRPHYVTALDYHEISRRFYEGLDEDDVAGVELIVDPKAHPAIPRAFPGVVRCMASPFVDRILGTQKRDMGVLASGATVAHLAVYLARHLGCNQIALVGQDLGFPDGLYYAPGTAIHDVWAPELSAFNTIAMMEWQRIVRHRGHLHERVDVDDKPIFTDTQMLTYLRQFERDFARLGDEGVDIIDATEGGVRKQRTRAMKLADLWDEHRASPPLPPRPVGTRTLDTARMDKAERRFADVRTSVVRVGRIASATEPILTKMLEDQADPARMATLFRSIEKQRVKMNSEPEAFDLISQLNQLGVFKRLKADRCLQMAPADDAIAQQRGQLERDRENVRWIADAATHLAAQLDDARSALRREPVPDRPERTVADTVKTSAESTVSTRVSAIIPVDPERSGLGLCRRLDEPIAGRNPLQRTLERIGRVKTLESIVLIAPDGVDLEPWLDRSRIELPVEIDRVSGSPFGVARAALAPTRRWAITSWRGGIVGTTIHDETVCPGPMYDAMSKRDLGAALVVGPDWPLVDVSEESGAPALVRRFRENPEHLPLVFTQAPPGLGACLVRLSLMGELRARDRWSTIGARLAYQPHAPRADAIATDANVQIDHRVRRACLRFVCDGPDAADLATVIEADDQRRLDAPGLVTALEKVREHTPRARPEQVVLELTPRRHDTGCYRRSLGPDVARPPMDTATACRIIEGLGPQTLLTLGGVGDPLLAHDLDAIIRHARDVGVASIHVRTELRGNPEDVERLLTAAPDVVSVDLHADRAETHAAMLGGNDFASVLGNLDRLLASRRLLTGNDPRTGLVLPWVVPRLQRRRESYADINTFFDRWLLATGSAVIEPPPPRGSTGLDDDLTEALDPPAVVAAMLRRRMFILSDGRVPVSELDIAGRDTAGVAPDQKIDDVWPQLLARREEQWASDPGRRDLWTLTP